MPVMRNLIVFTHGDGFEESIMRIFKWVGLINMLYPSLKSFLSMWGIDAKMLGQGAVIVARHAGQNGVPVELYEADLGIFDKYQSYQSEPIFGGAIYVVSFIASGGLYAKFIGVYRVLNAYHRGCDHFPQPSGSELFMRICSSSPVYHEMIRDHRFEKYRNKIFIKWDQGAIKWYRDLSKTDFPITAVVDDVGRPIGGDLVSKFLFAVGDSSLEDPFLVEENSYAEGAQYYRLHLLRDRDRRLIVDAKAAFKTNNNGLLFCEVCGFDFLRHYGDIGQDYIECHHKIPVKDLKPGSTTKVSDIALLCANCHRMAHRRRSVFSTDELRAIYRSN